tara:strand:+ start:219 stop:470 length:252 start_codon:yes stop_codon:yes gene_type:complete
MIYTFKAYNTQQLSVIIEAENYEKAFDILEEHYLDDPDEWEVDDYELEFIEEDTEVEDPTASTIKRTEAQDPVSLMIKGIINE